MDCCTRRCITIRNHLGSRYFAVMEFFDWKSETGGDCTHSPLHLRMDGNIKTQMTPYKALTSMANKVLPAGLSSSLRAAVRSRRDRRNYDESEMRKQIW